MRTDTSPYRTHQPLTAKQQLILDFITRGTARGIAPTIREIGQQFGIRSPNGVMCHVKALMRKGAIVRRAARESRSFIPADGSPIQRAIDALTAPVPDVGEAVRILSTLL
jgi:SOS-response transcriptional repressor LexA